MYSQVLLCRSILLSFGRKLLWDAGEEALAKCQTSYSETKVRVLSWSMTFDPGLRSVVPVGESVGVCCLCLCCNWFLRGFGSEH